MKKKFLLDVDVYAIRHIQYEVEADSVEDAIRQFNEGKGAPADPDEEDAAGDDYDIRIVTDTKTGVSTEL